MKNAVKEFERIQLITEGIFNKIIKSFTHPSPISKQHKLAGLNKKTQQILNKHQIDIESGAECKGLKAGKKPNNIFWSKTGDKVGAFGKNRNIVDDLGDFITKRELRCYDITKDIYGIAWLFADNAKFHANKIWGTGKDDVHFDGVWSGGVFKGIWESGPENWKTDVSNFKGVGLNLSQNQNPQPTTNQNPQPIEYIIWLQGAHTKKTFQEIAEMYSEGKIDDNTQIFRDGIGNARNYVFLSNLPEYPNIKAAANNIIAKRASGTV